MSTPEGTLLRSPQPEAVTTSNIARYLLWLERERGLRFADYDELWQWSVNELNEFWESLWQYFAIVSDTDPGQALADPSIDRAVWWPNAQVNFARHVLVDAWKDRDDNPDGGAAAVIGLSQTRDAVTLTWDDLRDQVARARVGLQACGVTRGSVVAAYLPNIPETVVAYLATLSLGAIWASVAPDMGVRGTLDRLAPLDPVVLLAVSGYGFAGGTIDRADDVATIRAGLPTVAHVIDVPYGDSAIPDATPWNSLLAKSGELEFEAVPFDHPMVILFTSGTTGRPKALVHRHGGLLVEHLKLASIMWDLGPNDRVLNAVSTSWMAWNALLSALLTRSTVVLHDGSPMYPDLAQLWRVSDEWDITLMLGVPAWISACARLGIEPCGEGRTLEQLRTLFVASAPLSPSGASWLNDHLPPHVSISVFHGGTDTCTAHVGGNPILPFWAGEMSARCLGIGVQAYDPEGNAVVGELGEMVITTPMPSMPVELWGEGRSGLAAQYQSMYPDVWRLGDWIRFSERGSAVVTGRSDATLNRGGIRMGTVDFYSVLESIPGCADSLVVHIEDDDGGPGEIVLFVVAGAEVTDDVIRLALRTQLSPRHTPDRIVRMPVVPRNRSGKVLEVPVKRLLLHHDVDVEALISTLVDPTSLDPYVAFAAEYP
jgi:acetoacetyl-CoA synthetase